MALALVQSPMWLLCVGMLRKVCQVPVNMRQFVPKGSVARVLPLFASGKVHSGGQDRGSVTPWPMSYPPVPAPAAPETASLFVPVPVANPEPSPVSSEEVVYFGHRATCVI